MRLVPSKILCSAALLASVATAFAFPHSRRGPTSPKSFRGKTSSKATKTSSVNHAGMSTERATEIQTALIKQGYLTGSPSGTWDKESQAAMEKMQSDNGWQTKLVPDSRAIIKLGLGPMASNGVATDAGEASASSSLSQ